MLGKKAHKRLELGPEWIKDTTNRLQKRFASEMKELEYWEDWGQLQLLVWQCPNKATTDQFLRWFESLAPGEIYELLSPWIKTFPEDLGTLRDRVCYFLSEWDNQYFSHIEPTILHRLHKDAVDLHTLQTKNNPVELIDLATNGLQFEPIQEDRTILLIPQYHSQPVTLLHCYEGITVCQYSSTEFGCEWRSFHRDCKTHGDGKKHHI